MTIPDYFLALNKQYGLALNDAQATVHAKAVTEAWYLSLSYDKQARLASLLPQYLEPTKTLFFNRMKPAVRVNQYELVVDRLSLQLQKTDKLETEKIIRGYFKALKVILSNEQKFRLHSLLDIRLQSLFALA